MTRDAAVNDRPVRVSLGWWRHGAARLFSLVHEPEEAVGSFLILPPLGLTAADLFMPAFYAATAGASAVRFDGRNNVGLSDGDVCDFRLGVLLEDARFAADRLVRTTGRDDFIIYGMSLTATVALLVARDYPKARVVLFVPVVDVCHAIETAAGEKGVMEPYRRREPDAAEFRAFFGHDIRTQPFFDDLMATGLGTIEGVLDAGRAVRGRVDLVMAENDQFSTAEDRSRLVEALGAEHSSILLERTTHNFARSSLNRKRAFDRLVGIVEAHFEIPEERRLAGLPADAAMIAAARMEQAAMQSMLDGLGLAA